MKKNVNMRIMQIEMRTILKTSFLLLLILLPFLNVEAKTGEDNFKTLCVTCHALSSKKIVGPGLAGMSERHSEEWLISWIRDSKAMIDAGDEAAVKIYEEYKKMAMPGFPQLSTDEIKDVIHYINDNEVLNSQAIASTVDTVTNGDNEKSAWSEYDYIGFLIVIGLSLTLYFSRRKYKTILKHNGYYEEPHKIPNYFFLFFAYIGIAGLLISILIKLLEKDAGMINELMFIALPYVSIIVFFVGSIYRYLNRGFQVSSLSTQFLEGRKLFWASQPFHWSILILFFGHLIAFLFPASVLAWNGSSVRLLILEYSSFAFGLTVLLGVVLLVKRRLSSKTLKVVANKMDMVVYTVLLTQIISGLGVAFYVRWGTSWFASVLSPYLISVFSFSPDISAVSEMPWLIQIHIISAFTIIGIIPFTRFVHFLVAPIDYLWRRYQLVIWNWNHKNIRTTYKWNFGKKPRNH